MVLIVLCLFMYFILFYIYIDGVEFLCCLQLMYVFIF